ncbi:MAG: hypothetical protein JNK04_03790 [Myxococcales bacterium]|nr:hypothetical protein [Myxococcales bacterium]
MQWVTSFLIGCGATGLLLIGCSNDTANSGGTNSGGNAQGAQNQGGSGADGPGGGNPSGGNAAGGDGGGTPCTPDCTGKVCGPDGCGGICGTCDDGDSCDVGTGQCVAFCGNSCEGSCGPCPSNSSQTLTCTSSGICKCNATCTPSCAGKSCGDDGCGGSCGPCDANSVCAVDGNTWSCEPFGGTSPDMSFFVTSKGTYDLGGNLGGLAGADSFCAELAAEAGVSGKTWRAYLSAGATAARDRIGDGPWLNARGDAIVSASCSDCVADLHANGIAPERVLTEIGTQIDWANAHDILTGSSAAGTPTGSDCSGWTSNDESQQATVGHSNEANNWASAHTTGCDRVGMQCTAGQGHLYCFAL